MDEQQAQQAREAAVKAKLAEMMAGGQCQPTVGAALAEAQTETMYQKLDEPIDWGKHMNAREKYWGELTPEEKIERMRDQVKALAREVSHLAEMMTLIRSQFPFHQHGPSGDVLIRAMDTGIAVQQAIGYGLERMTKDRGEEVYF